MTSIGGIVVTSAQSIAPMPAEVASIPAPASSHAAFSTTSRLPQATPAGDPSLNYDEQLGETFGSSWISMDYNVTAVAQTDSDGYGPAYLLNGLTDTGYWYQVGLSYDWPGSAGAASGFQMVYEVFDSNGNSIFPTSGGGGLQGFVGTVNSGDNVLLNLYIGTGTLAGKIVMLVKDYTTGAYSFQTYNSEGSTEFVGSSTQPSNSNGFFTGLMTEEYHSNPYYGNEQFVPYVDQVIGLPSAFLWMDERVLPGNSSLFYTSKQVFFDNYYQLQELASNGGTEYADAFVFNTGSDPVSMSLAATSENIDLTMPANLPFTATSSGGTVPYTYLVFLDNSLFAKYTSSSSTFSTTLNLGLLSLGNHTVYLDVVDAAGYPASSQTVPVNVNGDPFLIISTQSTADQGQTIGVNSQAFSGTPPYTEILYVNGQQQPQTSTVTLTQLGQNEIYAVLKDAAGYTADSNTVSLTVNPDPTVELEVSPSVLDVGQVYSANATIAKGTLPYYETWYVNGTSLGQLTNHSSTPRILLNSTAAGQYAIYIAVSDGSGFEVNSTAETVNVNPDPLIQSYNADGQSTNFFYVNNTAVSGVGIAEGTSPFTYVWYLNGIQVAKTNSSTYAYQFTTMGSNTLSVKIVDATGFTVTSKTLTVDFGYNFTHIALVIVIIVAIVLTVVFLLRRRRPGVSASSLSPKQAQPQVPAISASPPITPTDSEDPVSILKLRYARGEITKEQYEDMLHELRSDDR